VSSASPPARILLVRTSALGDIVHALPVLTALRRGFPSARIGWAVDEAFAPLLAGHRLLDELFTAPLRRARRRGSRAAGAREALRFLSRVRRFRPELALDLMGNHKGALIAFASGAPLRIGARRSDRREPASALWINRATPVAAAAHAVERGLALLEATGLAGAAADFSPEALRCGEEHATGAPQIYIHPGAAWGNKRYPPAQWGRVARLLRERAGVPIRVGSAPGEEHLADAVVAASAGSASRLDLPTLPHLAGALRDAVLVLAGDTGPLHLARALGRPVVGVYGPTDPALHGPYAAPEAALAVRLACSFCHRRMDDAKACLGAIPPEAIVERALAQL
jgi:lipopolysaccharide heptosyltransferase I